VIDIAAHMQKVAPPGGIAISAAAAQHVTGGAAAVGTEEVEISNTRGWVWRSKSAAPSLGAGPPPLPTEA